MLYSLPCRKDKNEKDLKDAKDGSDGIRAPNKNVAYRLRQQLHHWSSYRYTHATNQYCVINLLCRRRYSNSPSHMPPTVSR